LLIHGGALINVGDKKVKSQADTFMFDVETGIWKKFFVLEQPSAREQHTITKIGNLYYLYGGNQSPENNIIDELWALNLSNVAWSSKNLDVTGIVWEKI